MQGLPLRRRILRPRQCTLELIPESCQGRSQVVRDGRKHLVLEPVRLAKVACLPRIAGQAHPLNAQRGVIADGTHEATPRRIENDRGTRIATHDQNPDQARISVQGQANRLDVFAAAVVLQRFDGDSAAWNGHDNLRLLDAQRNALDDALLEQSLVSRMAVVNAEGSARPVRLLVHVRHLPDAAPPRAECRTDE